MPRGITEQDVFEAADNLLARGECPTIERVRQTLGTGSPNTVNRLLDLWWASLSKRMSERDEGVPASLIGLCNRLYEGMQAEAARSAGEVLAAHQHDLAVRSNELSGEKASLATERLALAGMTETLRQDLARTARENSELRSLLAAAEAARQASDQRVAQVQEENAALKLRVDAVDQAGKAEVDRVREQWQGNETRWLREIDRLRSDLKAAQVAHQKEARAYVSQLQQAQQAAASGEARALSLTQEMQRLELALNQERQARTAAEAELQGIAKALSRPRRSSKQVLTGATRRRN